jgi:hypothetical protein
LDHDEIVMEYEWGYTATELISPVIGNFGSGFHEVLETPLAVWLVIEEFGNNHNLKSMI